MNTKRIVALLIVFALFFTTVPFNTGNSALADSNDAILHDEKIILADFGYSNKANIKKRSDNFAYTNEFSADEKDTSMKFTLTSATKEMDVIPLIQRADWPSTGDLKFKMYNSGKSNNGFVLVICSLSGMDGWKPNAIEFCDLNPGWNEVSFPRAEIDKVINNSSADISDPSNDIFIRINCGGWAGNYVNTPGDVIYIDSIYLELPDYGSNIDAPVSVVANGAGYVESDLGNNNTYTLTFPEPVWHENYVKDGKLYSLADALEVYEYDFQTGEYILTGQDYDVYADGNDVNISFSSPLNDAAYKVVVVSDALITKNGKMLSEDYEYFFSVNMDSAIFAAVSSNPENGKVIDDISPGFEYIINFNNEIDPFDLEDMVSVTANGEPYSDYSVRNNKNSLIILFDGELIPDSDFVISISDEFADVYGFFIQGLKEFSFKTPDVIGKDGIAFDASDSKAMNKSLDKSMNPANSRVSVECETENVLSGESSFRINHTAITSRDENVLIGLKAIKNIKDYQYINYNIYCPKVTDEGVNLMLRTLENHKNPSNKEWYLYTLKTDWQGWKTISIPVESFSAQYGVGEYVDVAIFNFGGWSQIRNDAGYFLVDKIWLTDDKPTGTNLVSSEYETGSAYVASDLGGDNAFSFEFDSELFSGISSKCVKVEKYNGTGYDDFSDYEIKTDSNKLNVCFDSQLTDGTTLKITLDTSVVLSSEFATGESMSREYVFTVNAHTPFFTLESSSVEDGATITVLDILELVFNNELDKSNYVPDFISLYCDGEKVYNAFDSVADNKKLTLKFIKELKNGSEYEVVISPDYTDKFGNLFTGTNKISFIYGEKAEIKTTNVIFSAGDVTISGGKKTFPKLSSAFAMNESDLNFFQQNAKFNYKKTVSQASAVNGYLVRGEQVYLEGMQYFNMLAYSPDVTENSLLVVLYTDTANNKYDKVYPIKLDWQGWKLISIPLSQLVNPDSKVDGILFNMGGWNIPALSDGYLLFDAVWTSAEKPGPLVLESHSFACGDSQADIIGETLNLKFNAPINSETEPTFTLIDEYGNEVTDYESSIENREINIKLGKLSASTQYTLTIADMVSNEFSKLEEPVVFTFKTKSSGLFIGDMSVNDKTVTAYIENISGTDYEVKLTAYAIGDDNVLLEKISEKIIVSKNNVTKISESFSTNGEITDVKVFITDSEDKFISQKYFSSKSDSVIVASKLSGTTAYASVDSYKLNVNVFELMFSLNGVTDAAIIEIANSKSDVVSANIVKTDASGKGEFYYVFPEDMLGGNYTVTVRSDGIAASETFVYLSDNDRHKLLELSNGDSTSELASFLKENKEIFSLDTSTDEQIEDFASVIIDNAPFNTFSDAFEFVCSLTEILNKFNTATWSQLTVLIKEYAHLLGSDSNPDVKYFRGLSEKKQNEISKLLVKMLPEDTYESIKISLSDAIDKYADDSDSNTKGGSGGGGGSRGSSLEVILPVISDVNSGTATNNVNVFSDLSDVLWAADSIMTLYSANVVSYPADGKFRPNDDITREEFVKMLVCAFGENVSAFGHRFSDEIDGAWYNEYLSKAYEIGITKGYPDGSFGIGNKISREDMATMCARTLELLGCDAISSSSVEFTDYNDIADYAQVYVNSLAGLGAINGMGDGSFAPKSTATRAQAAKVIAKLMELV